MTKTAMTKTIFAMIFAVAVSIGLGASQAANAATQSNQASVVTGQAEAGGGGH